MHKKQIANIIPYSSQSLLKLTQICKWPKEKILPSEKINPTWSLTYIDLKGTEYMTNESFKCPLNGKLKTFKRFISYANVI